MVSEDLEEWDGGMGGRGYEKKEEPKTLEIETTIIINPSYNNIIIYTIYIIMTDSHVVWQKPTQCYKANFLQLKKFLNETLYHTR